MPRRQINRETRSDPRNSNASLVHRASKPALDTDQDGEFDSRDANLTKRQFKLRVVIWLVEHQQYLRAAV